MTRTKQITTCSFKVKEPLQTWKDSDDTLWVESRVGNWEIYSEWKERTTMVRDNLEQSLKSMKRKELQGLAKSRGISGSQTSDELIQKLLDYNIPSVSL
jgi:uncharacterized protein YbaP (TraB family)